MFLEQTGISNSQFADTCDIPRPTLSQLLNGRNKKVSDEVIGKIHRAYPTLNVMWLMFGDGQMLLRGSESVGASGVDSDDTHNNNESRLEDNGQRAISFDDSDSNGGYRSQAVKSQQRVASPSIETLQSMMRSAAGRNPKRGSVGENERRVVNIFVFYNDGRFEQFEPT